MSLNPSQSWASPGTALFGTGGAGGSNFPSGITIGISSIGISQVNISPVNPDTVLSVGGNFQAGNLLSGTYDSDYLIFGSTTITSVKAADGTNANLLNKINLNTPTSAFDLANINSISGVLNTTASNVGYNPINFTLRPDQAVKGGTIWAQFQYDAVDTGANYALVLGARNDNAIITSVWPGYISMPIQMSGATVEIASDNETFLFMDGNAGAIGTISTGTPLLSASNILNTITDPTKAYTADMTALFSTLKDLYPTCFI